MSAIVQASRANLLSGYAQEPHWVDDDVAMAGISIRKFCGKSRAAKAFFVAGGSGARGHVHAFQPLPLNIARLRRHLRINNIANVTVHPVAVSDKTGAVRFCSCAHSAISHISDDGALAVECVALDDLDLPLPRAIKMDIEGGECLALCSQLGRERLHSSSRRALALRNMQLF